MKDFLKKDIFKHNPCQFAVVDEKCYFCDHAITVMFNEHYTFCPSCAAIYNTSTIQTAGCSHIKYGIPCLDSPVRMANHVCSGWIGFYSPAFKKPFIYEEVKESSNEIVQKCSVCHSECVSDGW